MAIASRVWDRRGEGRYGGDLRWRRSNLHARYVSAGEVFTEEPGHVHFVRNEGTVPYEAYATFVLPVGVPSRTDAPSPGNCPF